MEFCPILRSRCNRSKNHSSHFFFLLLIFSSSNFPQNDLRGWEYAVDYDYSDWYPVIGSQGNCQLFFFFPLLILMIAYVRRRIWKKVISDPRYFTSPTVNSNSNSNNNTNNNNNHHTKPITKPAEVDPVPDTIRTVIGASSFHFIYCFSSHSPTRKKTITVGILIPIPTLTKHPSFSQVSSSLFFVLHTSLML